MRAEILCVGTELLMGQVLNTNTRFLAQGLAPMGIDLYYQLVVGDNPMRLEEAVKTSLSRSDILLLSGGLGPTEDDLTKETVAAAMDMGPLELVPEEWDKIVAYFARTGRVPSPNNRKQAMFPREGCRILPNPKGTAPGCIFEKDGKTAILMPGPPRELIPMFQEQVAPYLASKSDHRLYSRELRIFGMGEGAVEYALLPLIDGQTNPTLATYAETGEVKLRITARCQNESEGEKILTPYLERVRALLGDVVYSDEGKNLAQCCHEALIAQNKTLSCAESCTGGLLSSAFIDLPGSSSYFLEGDVTYAETAKMVSLGVRKETLTAYTAVSAQCAKEMAEGMRKRTQTDFALATTGYAGPDGIEVGHVFVALAADSGTQVKELHLTGDRSRIRQVTVLHALDILRRKLCTNK